MGEQKRKEGRFAPFRIGSHTGEVDVHVAETGNEKFAPRIDHPRVPGWRRLIDAHDAIAFD